MTFQTIDIDQGKRLIDEQEATIVDIRDLASYSFAHIENAHHIHNNNVEEFVESADKARPLLVYCYHGHSSLGAGEFFVNTGFLDVYSLDGGFESWRLKYPVINTV
ncbi:MAG: thiosulfate sulfurtransferase GlpE [Methylococcales bacterium]